jgi:hypothetical protein
VHVPGGRQCGGNGGNGGNGGAGGIGGNGGAGGNGGNGGDCTIIINNVTQVSGGFGAYPVPVSYTTPVYITVPAPVAALPDLAPCALPIGPVIGSIGNPVLVPVVVDGVVVDYVPLCQVFTVEPVVACTTGYYFYETDRLFYCFVWA